MAEEYLKVLVDLSCEVNLIGRNKEKVVRLAEKYRVRVFGEGISVLGNINCEKVDLCIIASSIDSLKEVSCACIERGVRNLLIEKPGALSLSQLLDIKKKLNPGINIRIAYNRRFYNSVLQLKNKIDEEGGALACFFDFTERESDIFNSIKSKDVIRKWGFANSIHVIDTAFYLIGSPVELNSIRAGSWDCHPSGNTFVGCGKTNTSLFSYFATWSGGGRWNIEVSTQAGRYRLCPLEELFFCPKNQFEWQKLIRQDDDDQRFKPGLYKMVCSAFLENNLNNLPNINEQIGFCKLVNKIFGYED